MFLEWRHTNVVLPFGLYILPKRFCVVVCKTLLYCCIHIFPFCFSDVSATLFLERVVFGPILVSFGLVIKPFLMSQQLWMEWSIQGADCCLRITFDRTCLSRALCTDCLKCSHRLWTSRPREYILFISVDISSRLRLRFSQFAFENCRHVRGFWRL